MAAVVGMRVLVNLGCGLVRPPGWWNFDSSLNSLFQRLPLVRPLARRLLHSTAYDEPAEYVDVRRRWPLRSGSVDVLYASHLLEHLAPADAQHFMREARRCLRHDGVLRLVVPDLYAIARRYVAQFERGETTAAAAFLRDLNLHRAASYDDRANPLVRTIRWWQGYPHQHKCMYDASSLRELLIAHDFDDVRPSSYGASEQIPEIRQVEATGEGVPAIYVEAARGAAG